MLELTIEQISMGQTAVDKSAALQLLADKLVADGLVAEGYLSGLQAREAQGSTFLGQGIAIPHGTPETRELVFTTGVRLLQFPDAATPMGEAGRAYVRRAHDWSVAAGQLEQVYARLAPLDQEAPVCV